MVVGFTGYSCSGKTTIAKKICEKYDFTLLSVRDISHQLANKNGYNRSRDFIMSIGNEKYLEICRQEILRLLSSTGDYIIDDIMDPSLWIDIVKSYDCLLLSFKLEENKRLDRLCTRLNCDWNFACIELKFLDDCKNSFGIGSIICDGQSIEVDGVDEDVLCNIVYSHICEHRFIHELTLWKKRVDLEIQEQGIQSMFDVFSDYPYMQKYCDEFINFSLGGKRIRAYLVKLGYELSGMPVNNDVLTAALSYEIFQSGVLIHDDVIDESKVRRKKPTYHVVFGDNHLGVSRAICAGDIGILIANEILLHTNLSDEIKIKAIDHQTKVYKLTIAGELADVDLSDNDEYSQENIISMYELKTSWYTIIGPLQLGAIIGHVDSHLILQIEKIGRLLGIAFQIKDDILGVFESSESTGKSDLSDVQEGKKTIITEHFLSHASAEDVSIFNSLYGNKSSGISELEIIRELLSKTNTYEFAMSECKRYLNTSRQLIMDMSVPEKCREELLGFIDYQEKRLY